MQVLLSSIKELLVYELKWRINQFESHIVPGYQVKNLVAQWDTRDFQNLLDPVNLHNCINTSTISLPHTSEPRLATNVP